MSLAKFRKVGSKNGAGRFLVSGDIAPATYLLPHPGLGTLYSDIEDDRFEIVITHGTILSVVTDSNGDSRVVPANGTATAQEWGDADAVDFNSQTGATPAPTTNSTGNADEVTVPAESVPIGCAQYDFYRPFDKGTSQGAGWIARGFVEWPLVLGLNDSVAPGDLVRSDHMGRPVKFTAAAYQLKPHLLVGKVIEVEKFSTNFDDGLLSYMQLPSDPGALKTVYEITKDGTYKGKLGIRGNLDVANSLGAFRVLLTL